MNRLLLLIGLVLLVGCGTSYEAEVKSNGTWVANVDGRLIPGAGNAASMDMGESSCVSVGLASGSFAQLAIIKKHKSPLKGDETIRRASVLAVGDIVTICR